MFCLDQPGPVHFPGRNSLRHRLLDTKQEPVAPRLTDMNAPMRQITFSVIRIGAMVVLAMGLILGLLPAILEMEATGL